jgi:tetratricopeptide (TPR) repeat protein
VTAKLRARAALPLVCIVLVAPPAAAQETDKDSGFNHFYNLEFDEALAVFSGRAAAQAGDANVHNHVAQTLLFREMLKAGALETEMVTGGNPFLRREKMNPSAEDRRRFDEAIGASMRLCQTALGRDARDAGAHYSLGVAHGLRANYNFLVRKAWFDALRDATAARRAHQKVIELDPSRVDARLIPATHEYVVANLPWTYRLLGFLAGFHGDREGGIRGLQLVARRGQRNNFDAQVLLATIYRRERRFQDAVDLLNGLIPKFPRNYLLRLELAQMYSDLGNKEAALAAVAEVEELKRAGTPGFARLLPEKILYFRATIQFWYRDYDDALANFRRVTAHAAELDPNTGVTAWLRLGQTLDLKGRREDAKAAYRTAIAYAPGSPVAREAEGYLQRPYSRRRV